MRLNSPGDAGSPLVRLAVILALVSVVVPVLVVRLPTLWDFPNHLVRYWILLGNAEGTPVASMYRPDWSLARTNIGSDLLAVGLGRILPFEMLTPFLVGLATLLPPLGAIVLNRTVFGGWHFWQVAIVALAWNFLLVSGLLSFQIALGVALLAAALDLRLRRLPVSGRWCVRLVLASGILVIHVFGLLFYLTLVLAIDIGPRLPAIRQPKVRMLMFRRMVLAGLACCLPLVVLILVAARLPGAHERAEGEHLFETTLHFWPLLSFDRLATLLTPFGTYSLIADLLTTAMILGLLIRSMWRRQMRMHVGLFTLGILVLLASQFMPNVAFGTALIDARFPVMGVLMVAAGVRPEVSVDHRKGGLILAVTLALVLARSGWHGYIWIERQGDLRSVEAATRTMPPGSAVMLAESRPDNKTKWLAAPIGRYSLGRPIYWHVGTTIVMTRHSFVPTIFTAAGKQPLEVLPAWKDLSVPEGALPSVDDLDDLRPAVLSEFPYLRDWRSRFDYVLLVNADMPSWRLQIEQVPGLSLVSDQGFARLYRIDRQP